MFYFYYGSIISPWLWASNSSRPFLCALATYALCGIYIYITLLPPRAAYPCFIKVTTMGGYVALKTQEEKQWSMIIMGIHCYFTQEDRRAFKATPVESIYATLSEVSGHILLWYKSKVRCLAPLSQYFLPLEPVCFCWARPHILWGDCYLLESCLEL